MKFTGRLVVAFSFLIHGCLLSTGFDNRFIPFLPEAVIRTVEQRSHIKATPFFMIGDSAYGSGADKKKGIPELSGPFDLRLLAYASETVGNTNRLSPVWQTAYDILWDVHGKIQGQGITFGGEYSFGHLSCGASTTFLHLSSNQKFVLPRKTASDLALTAADEVEIDQDRRQTLKDLGFESAQWSDSTLTDTEIFIRYGWVKEYVLKCRQAGCGMKFGLLLPSASLRPQNNPASIPFGGDDMLGFFWGVDGAFELKEDMWFNFLLNLSSRFDKTQIRRLPVKGEPDIFGATQGAVKVDPGVTVVVSPALIFNKIRDQVSLKLQYLFTSHAGDVWSDRRTDKTIPVDFSNIYKRSKWISEYLSCNVSYDCGTVSQLKKLSPVISFSWDIPVKFLKPRDVAKTQRLGLSIECRF